MEKNKQTDKQTCEGGLVAGWWGHSGRAGSEHHTSDEDEN